jgi:hypothetical protein
MRCPNNLFTFMIIALFFNKGITVAQSTTLKLPTSDNSSSFNIMQNDSTSIFRMFGDGGFYMDGEFEEGAIPIEGPGIRLMWYPGKGAFRVGEVTDDSWDDINIGDFSSAIGSYTIASGDFSTALGNTTTASGSNSTAMGISTLASGNSSTAMGQNTIASGNLSTATGLNTIASGTFGFTTGVNTTASGSYSTAMGTRVSTNSFEGSFIIGDRSSGSTVHNSSAENEMTMRFAGGYRFFTNSITSVGALLDAGANSWTTISDSTKKENFIYADGEEFLSNLSKLRLGSWNYKTQDPQQFRHYGPMAQEIFHYFGKDELGIIGNDTTLSTADMDGIMMVCVQALEKRTSELKETEVKISELEETILNQDKQISLHQNLIEKLGEELAAAREEIKKISSEMKNYNFAQLED